MLRGSMCPCLHLCINSSPGQRPCELMAWCGVCPSVCPSVRSFVRSSVRSSSVRDTYFRLLLWNYWSDFDETCTEASMGRCNSSLRRTMTLLQKVGHCDLGFLKISKIFFSRAVILGNLKPMQLLSVLEGLPSLRKLLTLTLIQGHSRKM